MDSPWIISGPLAAVEAITGGGVDACPTDSRMPLGRFVASLEQLARQAPDGAAIWRAGEALDLSYLGTIGDAMLSAPTLGAALRCFVSYFGTVQSATTMTMQQEDDQIVIRYRVLDEDIWPRAADAQLTLGIFAGAVHRYAPRAERAITAQFEDTQTRAAALISAHLGRPVRSGPENRLIIPMRLMEQRAVADDGTDSDAAFRQTVQALDAHLRQLRLQQPVSDRVLDLLLQQMGQGDCDQDAIARRLGMSRRTLRRRLEAEGQSFQQLNEICRRNIGRALLTRSDLPMIEIALRLGYSDHTAFSRAFSRWFGMSPRELRKSGAGDSRIR